MSFDKTRVVRLEGGQVREEADNSSTLILSIDESQELRARVKNLSFHQLFINHYPAIRQICNSFNKPGVAVIAIDAERDRSAGSICIAAKPDRINVAIVGRHSMADLFLDADQNVSLRHLAVVVHPAPRQPQDDLRFRMLDLRTPLSLEDEEGRRLEALVAEGPIFIRCGRYVLYCLPTGDPVSWPDGAENGWQCIPERVYLEETDAEPDRWRRRRPARPNADRSAQADDDRQPPKNRGKRTLVQAMAGPKRAQKRLLVGGEPPIGTLRINNGLVSQKLIIGARAAQQGVLIGRYDRCDTDGASLLADGNISRVHLLALRVDQRLYAIDTASTNGTWIRDDDTEVRVIELTPDNELMLGENLAFIKWCPGD